MWKTWELFVLVYFVSLVESYSIREPLNVSLSWTNEFEFNLSWTAPEKIESGCKYKVLGLKDGVIKTKRLFIHGSESVENGLSVSVQTSCGESTSKPVVRNVSSSGIVKDFQCSLHTNNLLNCSWIPANNIADIQLFYRYNDSQLKVCSHYLYKDKKRIGCHLTEKDLQEDFYFLVNGTLNGFSVRNTYRRILLHNIKAPRLNITLTPEGNHLNIAWTPPDIHTHTCWNYTINYTVCGDQKPLVALTEKTSYPVHFFQHCQYRIAVKAVLQDRCGKGESPWNQIIYGNELNRHASMYVALATVPVMVALAAVLAFVCLRRYKEKIIPKVPEPVDFFQDIFNKHSDPRIMRNLYVPAQEEVNCKLSLVQQLPTPDRDTFYQCWEQLITK